MKLSIIIPVYNVAPYVRKCVESVLAQDLDPKEYEIILVDDGSTDGSGEICDKLVRCKMHDAQCTIHVLHQENQGLSAARNAGIAVAQGKYVQFVDSDDYLEPNVLGGLVEQMEREELDVLRFDYQNVRISSQCTMHNAQLENSDEAKYEVFEPNKTPRKVDTCTAIVDGETYLNTRMGYACYAVQFMIRRTLLDGCLFTQGIHFEDVEWTPRMVLRAKRMNATAMVVYNYLMREGSITKVVDSNKMRKNLDDKFVVIDTLSQLLVRYPTCQWLRNMRSVLAEGVVTTVATHFYGERKRYIAQLRAQNVFPLSLHQLSKTYLRRAVLINVNPKLYCWIRNVINL